MTVTATAVPVTYETPSPGGSPTLPLREIHGRAAPAVLQRWHVRGSATGDATAGDVIIPIDIRRTQATTPKLYVAVTTCWFTAPSAADNILINVSAGEFVEFGTLTCLWKGTSHATALRPTHSIQPLVNPMYLGEVNSAQFGRLNLTFDTNTNAAAYEVFARGWAAEQPFELPLMAK